MSSLIYLNSGFQEQKHVEINLIAYKLMVEKSLLVLLFKVFIKNKELRLAMLYHICMKKMGQ